MDVMPSTPAMKTVNRILALSLILLGCRGVILAALLSVSDPRFGENTLTLDTSTSLAWLDLPISSGLSYDQVLAATQPGGALAGFSLATTQEVADFFRSADLLPGGFYPESGTNTAKILSFISLVGATSSQNNRPEAFGITGSPAVNGVHYVEGIDFFYANGAAGYGVASPWGGFGDSYGTGTVGSWLVEVVPEPAAWRMAAIAAFMLAGRRCSNLRHNCGASGDAGLRPRFIGGSGARRA